MKADDGGAAFPSHEQPGMSTREWFAGQALIGIIVSAAVLGGSQPDAKECAAAAYAVADAMLNAEES